MDNSNFWSTVISILFGGLITVAAAHFYFWLSKPVEKRLASIADNLRHLLVRERFSEFFASPQASQINFESSPPKKPDVPHLDYAFFDRKTMHPGTEVKLLLKVVDLGFNFPNPRGAKLTDETGSELKLENVGFGCMVTSFRAPDAVGERKLTLVLTDEDENGKPLNKSVPFELKYSVSAPAQ